MNKPIREVKYSALDASRYKHFIPSQYSVERPDLALMLNPYNAQQKIPIKQRIDTYRPSDKIQTISIAPHI